MAKVKITKKMQLKDGVYTGVISEIQECKDGTSCWLKITMGDETIFLSYHKISDFSKPPLSIPLEQLDSDDTDDLIGKKVSFTIKNNTSTKTGINFCNITKISITG